MRSNETAPSASETRSPSRFRKVGSFLKFHLVDLPQFQADIDRRFEEEDRQRGIPRVEMDAVSGAIREYDEHGKLVRAEAGQGPAETTEPIREMTGASVTANEKPVEFEIPDTSSLPVNKLPDFPSQNVAKKY